MSIYDLGYNVSDFAKILGVDVVDGHTASLIIKTKEGEYLRVYLTTGIVVKVLPKKDPEKIDPVRVVRLNNEDKS